MLEMTSGLYTFYGRKKNSSSIDRRKLKSRRKKHDSQDQKRRISSAIWKQQESSDSRHHHHHHHQDHHINSQRWSMNSLPNTNSNLKTFFIDNSSVQGEEEEMQEMEEGQLCREQPPRQLLTNGIFNWSDECSSKLPEINTPTPFLNPNG